MALERQLVDLGAGAHERDQRVADVLVGHSDHDRLANGRMSHQAGLDLAAYVDPNNQAQVTDAIERYATDPIALAEARSRIAAWLAGKDRLPSWSDAARTVLEMAGSRP